MVDLSSAAPVASGALSAIAKYAWVGFGLVGIAIAIAVVFILKMVKDKKKQWTHKFFVRKELADGRLGKGVYVNARRYPLIKGAEVLELETPILGGYLIPELDEYSDLNEFSIIIDKANRIYKSTGEYLCKDKSSVNVSARHAEIDIGRADLRADFQLIHKTSNRMEWSKIAKFAMVSLLIVCTMVVLLVGFGKWGEAQDAKAKVAEAEANTMIALAEAMETSQSTANTQVLILEKLNELYGTKNIQGVIRQVNGEE